MLGGPQVNVISKKHLKKFWEARKHDADIAERDLSVWYKLAKSAGWENFADLKLTFPSADQVGNCIVFDVGNNRYRLIGRVNYTGGRVYVLKVMDHKEYDKDAWPGTCRCHEPPPRRPDAGRTSRPRKRGGQ